MWLWIRVHIWNGMNSLSLSLSIQQTQHTIPWNNAAFLHKPFDIPSNFPLEMLLLPYFLFLVRMVYRVFESTHQDIEFKIHFIFLIQTLGTMKAITGSEQKNETNRRKKNWWAPRTKTHLIWLVNVAVNTFFASVNNICSMLIHTYTYLLYHFYFCFVCRVLLFKMSFCNKNS